MIYWWFEWGAFILFNQTVICKCGLLWSNSWMIAQVSAGQLTEREFFCTNTLNMITLHCPWVVFPCVSFMAYEMINLNKQYLRRNVAICENTFVFFDSNVSHARIQQLDANFHFPSCSFGWILHSINKYIWSMCTHTGHMILSYYWMNK